VLMRTAVIVRGATEDAAPVNCVAGPEVVALAVPLLLPPPPTVDKLVELVIGRVDEDPSENVLPSVDVGPGVPVALCWKDVDSCVELSCVPPADDSPVLVASGLDSGVLDICVLDIAALDCCVVVASPVGTTSLELPVLPEVTGKTGMLVSVPMDEGWTSLTCSEQKLKNCWTSGIVLR